MSNFSVEIVKLGSIGKHPNADSLGLTQVFGQNCIFNLKEDWREGDLAIYVPSEAVVPLDRPYFVWLAKDSKKTTHRVKPAKLRGIYSEGFLIRPSAVFDSTALANLQVGQNVAADLGVTKYVEPEDFVMSSDCEKDPGFMPHYNVESYFRYKHLLNDGEEVVATEKIHGCNCRFAYVNGRLWVGSHGQVKKQDPRSLWWKIAFKYDLENKLKMYPDVVFYGEVYGYVQDLQYSVPAEETIRFRIFDAYHIGIRYEGSYEGSVQAPFWFNHDEIVKMAENMGLETVPVIYRGSLDRNLVESLRFGLSTLDGKTIREGVVVRPVKERRNIETGRTLFKLVSEDYKLRKNGTERK
jgi:RNA ligase (TIGR02306 family)